jgi:hypothetical protein
MAKEIISESRLREIISEEAARFIIDKIKVMNNEQ